MFCWNCLQSKYHRNCRMQITQHTSCHCECACARASWSQQKQFNPTSQDIVWLMLIHCRPACANITPVSPAKTGVKSAEVTPLPHSFHRKLLPEEGFCHMHLHSFHHQAICESDTYAPWWKRTNVTVHIISATGCDSVSVLYMFPCPHPFSFGQNEFFFFSKQDWTRCFQRLTMKTVFAKQ